jgi:hypothetical protein
LLAGFLRDFLGHGGAFSRRAARDIKPPSEAVRQSVAGENGSSLGCGTGLGNNSPATPVDIGSREWDGFRVQPLIVGKSGESLRDGAGTVPSARNGTGPQQR